MEGRRISGRALLIGVGVIVLAVGGAAIALGGDDSDSGERSSDTTAGPSTTSTASLRMPVGADQAEVTAVTVGKSCVRPGERQTVTIQGAPGTQLIYQAIYADGASGIEPHYPGGNEQGQISPDGTLKSSWVVGKKAASGTVKVDVYDVFNTASLDGAAVSTTFEIPPKGASCEEADE